MQTTLTGNDRKVYMSLIRAYKVCIFAGKKNNKAVTRDCAAKIKRIRLDNPKVFARFVDWNRTMRRNWKAPQN